MKVFIHAKNKRDKDSCDFLRDYMTGKFGVFSKTPSGMIRSLKAMIVEGWKVHDISMDEYQDLISLQNKRMVRISMQDVDKEVANRYKCVEHCLKCEPISPISVECHFDAFIDREYILNGTGMDKMVDSDGKGVAYIVGEKLVAFHYGIKQPGNIPPKATAFPAYVIKKSILV